jgi:hypothetical protein
MNFPVRFKGHKRDKKDPSMYYFFGGLKEQVCIFEYGIE